MRRKHSTLQLMSLSSRGFTLLELSMVLVMIAFVVGGGIALLTASLQKRQLSETQTKLQTIQKALLDYRRGFNRLPCPADITLAVSNVNFGVEAANPGSCLSGTPAANASTGSDVEGMVPTQALRLGDDYAFDGWGRRIAYAVDNRFTAAFTQTASGVTTIANSTAFTLNGLTTLGNINVTTGGTAHAATASGNSATFVKTDTSTEGSWLNLYGGTNGQYYSVPVGGAVSSAFPSWATASFTGATVGNWSTTTTDIRGLYKPSNHATRTAGYWYNAAAMTLAVSVTGGSGQVSLYMMDWDSYMRSQQVQVLDASTSAVLDTRVLSPSFYSGVYYSWQISGNVKFVITSLTTNNAVVSGLFFDNFSASAAANYSPAVYALISYGANGHGAIPHNGGSTVINAGSTNSDEQINCSCNSSAAYTAFTGTFVQKPPTLDTTTQYDAFDDIVVYATRTQLRSLTE